MADSEKYFTKLVDGQLSVATVAQSGEIIPEETRPGDVYTTALVQTDDGPQLCVKTYDLNGGGGGGGGTVDQTYDPTSTNAQSGTAVAEAVAPSLKNKATNPFYSLMIADRDVSLTGNSSVVINPSLIANQSLSSATAVGAASAVSNYGTSVGYNSYSATSGLAVGMRSIANSQYGIAIGTSTNYSSWNGANVDANSVRGIAIGTGANVSSAEKSIQLGEGTNSTANTFQVFDYQMLDGTTGKIPGERLPGTTVYGVMPNFEVFDRSNPYTTTKPEVTLLQEAYSFTDNANIRIPNVIAQVNNVTSFDIYTAILILNSQGGGTDGIITILPSTATNDATLRITKDTSHHLRLRVSFLGNGTDDIDITATTALTMVTKYYLHISYSSTDGYKVLVKTANDENWTELISSSLTTGISSEADNIDFGRNGTAYFRGVVYMRDTYINVNGQRVFNAVNKGQFLMVQSL